MRPHFQSLSSQAISIILFVFAVLSSFSSNAQDPDPFTYASRLQPSADAWQISRHGEISPDLYTGAMAWSLPLYTYKDEDFTIPISLDYRFDGCRPYQPSGTVGSGWSLNCGGIITRRVVGLPDDYINKVVYDDLLSGRHESWELGFYFATIHRGYMMFEHLGDSLARDAFMNIRHCTAQPSPVLQDLSNNSLTAIMGATPLMSTSYIIYHSNFCYGQGYPSVEGGPYFDPNSDIYHFSLPEVSGDFIIMPNGCIRVFNCTDPEGELKVEIFFSELQTTSCSSMIVITRKGFRYVFGGDVKHIEYNYDTTLEHYTNPYNSTRYCFTALFLNDITAPNGRHAAFLHNAPAPCSNTLWKPTATYRATGITGQPSLTLPGASNTISRPLQSIVVDGDTLINFHYGNKTHAEFGYNSFQGLTLSQYRVLSPLGQGPPLPDSTAGYNTSNRLSSIAIRNRDNDQIDSITLTHSYTSSSPGHSPKMFLRSVQGNAGHYTFDYVHATETDAWPAVNTVDTDHWGYWDGTAMYYSVADTNRQQSSLYDLPIAGNSPDTALTMYGALRSIGYPSGGRTTLEYEPNRASRRIDVDVNAAGNAFSIDSVPSFLAGGVRLRKVTNIAGSCGSFRDSVEYEYGDSGVLMKMVRYYSKVTADYLRRRWTFDDNDQLVDYDVDSGVFTFYIFNPSGLFYCGADEHIVYPEVRIKYSDGSFTDLSFAGLAGMDDRFIDYNELNGVIPGRNPYTEKFMSGVTSYDSHIRSAFTLSGLGSAAMIRNARQTGTLLTDFSSIRNKLVAERTYSLDSILLRESRYNYCADTVATVRSTFNIYSDFLAADRTFVQPRLDSVITTEYLPGGGVLSDTTSYTYNSLGQQRIVERRGFDGSVRRSRFSYEHESDATAPPANVAAVATSRLYVDGNNRSEYLTSLRHIEYETDSALRHLPILSQEFCSKAPRFPVVNDGGIEWFAPKSTDDTLARRLSYNALQRPALLSLPGGAYVAFTWDASGRYPLSREDNGPAMVSSYEWKDMVGLTRKTDPTLRSEWYGYDEKNRLSEVYRADSVLVREYDHHIYSEDTTLGPSSIKQTIWRTANKNNREIAYYDGLGYPIQKVRTSTQTTGGHIVTPIAYDALRRDDAKVYLPYGANYATYDSAAFRKQQHHYRGYGKDSLYAYTEKEYGTSPAGRLLSVRKPGKAYADSAKKVVYEYRTNIATDSVLNMYATVDTLPKLKVGSGYLPAGKLLLTKTTDEDGCTSEVFTNSAGKTILSRQRTGGQRLDTYRVYDLRDSLICVLQPEGAASIQRGSSHALLPPVARNDADTIPTIGTLLDNYAFLYAWDSWGRLAAKKRPGAAAEEFLSDDRGRVVLSRDGNLRNQGKWLYSEYDEYDALLRKSLITVNLGLDTLRQAARGQVDSIFTYPDTILMWPYYYRQDPEIFYYGRTASLAAGDSLFTPELDYIGDVESAGNDPSFGHYIVFEMERYYVGSSRDSIATGPVDTMVTNWPAILANAVTNSTLLEEHRYDRGDSPGIPQALDFMSVTGIVTAADTSSTRNLEVWQRQLMLPPGRTVPGDTTRYVERAFYYDVPGNLVQTVETNALGGISRTSTKYDYLGNVIVSEEKHAVSGNNTPTVKRSSLTYDSLGRIASEDVTVNGTATGTLFDYDLMGRQTYAGWSAARAEMVEIMLYDICGRLTDKETFRTWNEVGGEEAERGRWSITGVATTLDTAQAVIPLGNRNGDDGEEQEPEEPDLPADQLVFKQHLKYFNPTEQSSQPRWNGLISEIAHQRTDTGTVITNGYFYDHAGRLTDHIRYDGNSQTSRYTERDLSFDRNGNILTLKRYGTNVAAPQDNLTYTYEGNKLMQLNNATYQYDSNGNMTHDGRRGLDLSWNHLNLPSSICSDEDEDALVNYTYLADGTKVITQQPAAGEGYAYLGSATYKLVNNVWTLESVPFTGGRFIAGATGGMDEYRYITDHLGSTRVIVTGTDYHEVEHNDYYPFGMRIADSSLPTTATNRWRFSGKEIQTLGGINLIDFGSRLYDNDAVNWKSQDPMAESYFGLTPYGYCGGNPVNAIDPNGRDIYMLFYVTDNKMFKASAETRKREIERMKGFDSEKDIVIMFEFSDLSEIGDMANRIIDTYSEQYGQTAEVGVWSHAGWDGPIGAIQTSGDYAIAYSQMSLEGWNSINFNWNSDGANMSFYGCNTGNDNNSGQRGGSFARNISKQSNFKGVNVWGQQTSSYPSFSPYIRATSYARAAGFGYGIGPTYMVGGNKGQGVQALGFMLGNYPRANPMNVYKNGRLVRSAFQNR